MDALAYRRPWWSIALLAIAVVAAPPSHERIGAAASIPALSLRASIARNAALAQIAALEEELARIDRRIQGALEDPPFCRLPSRRHVELARQQLDELRRKQAEYRRKVAEAELARSKERHRP